VADPGALRITTTVNGELRQDATLEDMRFDWPSLVAYWSQIGLRPGDVIAGGTPAGVAFGRDDDAWYLRPGDRVEVDVDGLGTLRTDIGLP
jgi:2-keto-4-pentenoate hydratase/2-oxohepta-3-ene-1,7-dioic acid hydratase in catechol pathway